MYSKVIQLYTHMHTHICVCIYIYIYIYIYIHIYISFRIFYHIGYYKILSIVPHAIQ